MARLRHPSGIAVALVTSASQFTFRPLAPLATNDQGTDLAWAPDASYLVFTAVGQATGAAIPEMTPTAARNAPTGASAAAPAAERATPPDALGGGATARQAACCSQEHAALGICALALPDLYVYTPPAG